MRASLLILALLFLSWARGAAAQVPPALQPWVPWVLEQHPDLRCPEVAGARACVWPGALQLQVTADGGGFVLDVSTDRAVDVTLPGGEGAWPLRVTANGRPAVVRDVGGAPVTTLPIGITRLAGSFRWPSLPPTLRVPALVALVDLRVDGVAVPWPRREEDGTLRLGGGAGASAVEDRLDLDVARRVSDGVPVEIQTEIRVRASGAGREVDLGVVGLDQTRAVSLSADLPARFTAEGHLIAQVRPGSYTLSFTSIHDGPVPSLRAPSPGAGWPETEVWAVATDDRVRAVTLSGAPSVDPGRTTLPEAWRALPAFLMAAGAELRFEELRRGDATPPPNQLSLQRALWLDLDGGGLTVRDTWSGTMYQGWRLAMAAPGELGHVADHGVDQVVTRADDRSGVALRRADVALTSEGRLPGRPRSLSAVGWDADVVSLSADLNLPPGWTLWAATGVDDIDGALLDQWTLLDLFFVLVLAVATARLHGVGLGAVALGALTLSRQEPEAPEILWVVLLVLGAVLRVAGEGWPQRLVRVGRGTTLLGLVLVLLPFSLAQVRGGLFPALSRPYASAGAGDALVRGPGAPAQEVALDGLGAVGGRFEDQAETSEGWAYGRAVSASSTSEADGELDLLPRKQGYLSLQLDPSAVVQTGPGVPSWTWDTARLSWSGPVRADQEMRLWLVGPTGNAVLAIARVALLLWLALRLGGWSGRLPGRAAAAPLALLLLLPLTAQAQTIPPAPPAAPDLLDQLEARLTRPPACAPACVSVSEATLAVAGDQLIILASVHAEVDAAWPVPGPAATWTPRLVRVDGKPTAALARLSDGFVHVRLTPGVHEVQAEGPLPPTDALTLQFGLVPHRVDWANSPGWAVSGLRANGTVERALQLARAAATGDTSTSAENLTPWLTVRRSLDLGLPWRVMTTVTRQGAADRPLSLRVPLLTGEAVTDAGVVVQSGAVLATLDRDQTEISWLSTLANTDTLTLQAPEGVPWVERWIVSCSPIYTCRAEGPAPVRHTQQEAGLVRWAPEWWPWPGETVTVSIARPDAAPGQTVTLDQVTLDWTPGRRIGTAKLSVQVRTSQGGQQAIRLPEGAALQEVRVGGEVRPIQARDGVVPVPLQPGAQQVELSWQQPAAEGALGSMRGALPAVDLGAPAVNTTLVVHPSDDRWTLWLQGPVWGPKPLIWSYVLVVLLAAGVLARVPGSPLSAVSWALLGLGLTQVHPVETVAIAGWFLALSARGRRQPTSTWLYDLLQLALLGLTALVTGFLWHAVYTGLLLDPEMQISGNASSAALLQWYVDRVGPALPRPVVWSLPIWTWRAAMLAWAIWLAFSLVRWAPWAWRCASAGGLFRLPSRAAPLPAQKPPGYTQEPDAASGPAPSPENPE